MGMVDFVYKNPINRVIVVDVKFRNCCSPRQNELRRWFVGLGVNTLYDALDPASNRIRDYPGK
jgi:hypothetical protein